MKALTPCGLLAAFILASIAPAASSATWHIYADGSGDAATIKAAVAAAATNDSILVHAGIYYEHDIYVTKRLYIVGVAGAASTIIDAQTSGRCYLFSAPTSLILIKGFTMRRGTAAFDPVYNGYGGAIIARHLAHVMITDCVFEDNMANLGGAIAARDSSTVSIRRCSFTDNTAYTDNVPGAGGAVHVSGANPPNYMLTVVIDSCLFARNTASSDGGAISLTFCDIWVMNSTLHENYAASGGGTIALSYAGIALERSIVTSSNGYGIIAWFSLLTSGFSCNDFYGNASGNYGGLISDQTGSNNNISANPLYCSPPSDLTISTISPCAAANSPCGQQIGRYGPACGPNLKFSFVWFSPYNPWLGATTTGMVRVKNAGSKAAGPFYIDYYKNSATPPAPGVHGDERHLVAGLAAGDSVSWTTSPVTYDQLAEWKSYFRVDTDAQVSETNESDNLTSAQTILWVFPLQGSYPWAVGTAIHSSPVIAPIDEDLSSQEIAFGGDNGKLYVMLKYGGHASGFPVQLDGPVWSSPAVGNITGNFWNEIVVGCDDGYLYAFDHRGTLLWRHLVGGAIRTTPALGDLDGDGLLDVVCASGTKVVAINGDGKPLEGWPYEAEVAFRGVAIGDADSDGDLEIAAAAQVNESVSKVYLFQANGELYGVEWPVQLDAVLQAGPAMGNIFTMPIRRLEIVVGATSGHVYVLRTNGTVWSPIPKVTGSISTPPIISDLDGDGFLDIVVTSKVWALGGDPPVLRWNGYVTALNSSGSVLSGWPQAAGGWATDVGPVPSATALGSQADVFAASPLGRLYAWHGTGVKVPTFPEAWGFPAPVLTSAAAGDVDGDGWTELFVVTAAGNIHGCKMQVDGYGEGTFWWPMYGHDRQRTFCYGFEVPTGVDDGPSVPPAVTALGAIYPNPFNPTARVAFDLSSAGRVEIAVYDVAGRLVATLVDRELPGGRHEAIWNGRAADGRPAASGVYLCTLRAAGATETKKLVLLR